MTLRTGIDCVSVSAVQTALDTHGDRYLTRIYTGGERSDCTGADGVLSVERLAGRWAAKEAAVKALRAGAGGFAWTDVEVLRAPGGHPELMLHGPLRRLASEQGMEDISVSITHESGLAMAIVVAMAERQVSVEPGNDRQ
jgi:holo-[acyl-carrier protein] synthase